MHQIVKDEGDKSDDVYKETNTVTMSIAQSPADAAQSPEDQSNAIIFRLAETPDEIMAAQKLRYKVFYEEFQVPAPPDVEAQQRDFDDYDPYADHLIAIDESISDPQQRIVATYRLFQQSRLPSHLPFYSSHEFNITPLLQSGAKLLELGRSCVLPNYRTKHVMQKLWQGIADYLATHDIDLMFGCASFQETDPAQIADQLAYLAHYHTPPENLCPVALPDCTDGLSLPEKETLNAKRVFAALPPLIKGYLRLGAFIGKGAFLDKDLKCIDVCIVLPTHSVSSKYVKHFERKLQRDVVRDTDFSKSFSSETLSKES